MWRLYLGVWNLWPLQCWWKNANNWRCDKKCFTTLARWDLHIWHSTQSEKPGIYLCTLMSPLLRSASGVYWPQHVAVWWRRRGVTNDSPWYSTSGALSVPPEIRKILKRAQIVWKFHAKVSRKSENGWISEKRTIHLKVPESLGGNQMETKFLFTSQDCPLFREIWNGWIAFTTRNFWKFKPDFSSDGKCPRLPVWVSLDQSPLHVKPNWLNLLVLFVSM